MKYSPIEIQDSGGFVQAGDEMQHEHENLVKAGMTRR
jgi:hypothetical protein